MSRLQSLNKRRRRGRKSEPFSFDLNTVPPYDPAYLPSRYREYQAYDSLPPYLRKALRRTKREWQATQILNRLKDGDNPLDIIRDLERCEQAYSEQHLDEHDLTKGDFEWRLRQQEK